MTIGPRLVPYLLNMITLTVALDMALLFIAEGQTIYHTLLGPVR